MLLLYDADTNVTDATGTIHFCVILDGTPLCIDPIAAIDHGALGKNLRVSINHLIKNVQAGNNRVFGVEARVTAAGPTAHITNRTLTLIQFQS